MKTLAQTSVEEDDYDDDLLGGVNTDDVLGGGGSASAGGGGSGGGDLLDLMDDGPVASAPAPATTNVAKTLYLKGEKGISIQGAMVKRGDNVEVVMDIANASSTPAQALAVQLEKNVFGLTPVSNQLSLPQPISNGSMGTITMPKARPKSRWYWQVA